MDDLIEVLAASSVPDDAYSELVQRLRVLDLLHDRGSALLHEVLTHDGTMPAAVMHRASDLWAALEETQDATRIPTAAVSSGRRRERDRR